MNSRDWSILLICAGLCCTGGCIHRVKYVSFVKYKIPPTEQATTTSGSIEETKSLLEQAKLPHNTIRQRVLLERRAAQALWSQLGSSDYIAIGEVYGSGNARANLESLKAAFCKKAAREGGDVVMIFNSGVAERPFVYTTPGYATTNVTGSAYRAGNYVYGSATGHTTYMPGQTFSGVMHLPYGNGLVFKYVPGVDRGRAALLTLTDDQLAWAIHELEALRGSKSLTFEEYMDRREEILIASGKK